MSKTKLFMLPVLVFPFLIGCGATKEYTITWNNYDGKTLTTTKVKENELPTYSGDTPTKPSTETEAFIFNDWDPEVVVATCDATYTATYTPVKIYEILWYNDIEETKLLHSEKVKLGDTPTYHWKDKPSKEGTDQIKYKWNGWEETLIPVTGPAKYHAHFDVIAKHKVTFINDDEEHTVLQESFVAEDETPKYEGTPTKPSKDGVMYTFKGWDSELVPPKADSVYTAVYNEIGAVITMIVNVTEEVKGSNEVSFRYDFEKTITVVDWGDGEIDALTEHSYTEDGTYTVYIWGTLTSFTTQSPGVTSITLSGQITSIIEFAFAYSKLQSIVIPSSVTKIESRAFMGCNLLTIYCETDSQPASWDTDWNFSNCPVYWSYIFRGSTSEFDYVVQKIKDVNQITISKYIGDSTVSSITIPEKINEISVTSIASAVFRDNLYIQSVNLPNSLTSIGSSVFFDCTSLNSINIPNVATIGAYAFYGCSALTSITIPNSVTSIGEYAFERCTKLQFNVDNNLNYLGNDSNKFLALVGIQTYAEKYEVNSNCKIIVGGTFHGPVVVSVIVTNSVTLIGTEAFKGCSKLEKVDLSAIDYVISGASNMFDNCSENLKIVVKSERLDDYKTAPYWSNYANIIVTPEQSINH